MKKHTYSVSIKLRCCRQRFFTAFLLLTVFGIGLAHGWLHLVSNDHDGHFAHNDSQCCLVQNLGGGIAPPLVEIPPPEFVSVLFAVAIECECYGRPASIGYSPRDPPIA
ncbi:MAG: hypothetical protein WAN51_01745 [Alphaproteobacteria bacterium]